jgi:hypothetical protein
VGAVVRIGAGFVVAAAMAGALGSSAAVAAAAREASVKCPGAASSAPAASTTSVVWEFSELGPPTPAGVSVTSSWTRGAGIWSSGEARGTICSNDTVTGMASRDLVLTVSGASELSPQITRLGMLGVAIALPVSVSASNDAACARGTPGTLTLFASYYGVHRASIVLHFASACADHDHTFTGAAVRVLIARDGRQVSTATP